LRGGETVLRGREGAGGFGACEGERERVAREGGSVEEVVSWVGWDGMGWDWGWGDGARRGGG